MSMPKSRVFAVTQPTRKTPGGDIINSLDLSPAEAFGEVILVCHPFQDPFKEPEQTLATIRDCLTLHLFGPQDYLLLVGSPILIGWVSIAAAERVPVLRMLQWTKRENGQYRPVELQLNPLSPSLYRG